MQNEYYYKTLNIDQNSSIEDVRRSYHSLAKQHHPDLFPNNERYTKQLQMMKINEAYMAIISYLKNKDEFNTENNTAEKDEYFDININNSEFPQNNQIGELKDPAYTYYKLGFKYYTEGQVIFHKRFSLQEYNRIKNIFMGRSDLLKLAISAIQYFEKSYTYFLKVINDYSESMWADDALAKLDTLEKFNDMYKKICDNISSYF